MTARGAILCLLCKFNRLKKLAVAVKDFPNYIDHLHLKLFFDPIFSQLYDTIR
jgi:hypothetical protein